MSDGEATLSAAEVIDISTIDLTEVAISADEVGKMLPQCGDMRHLDHIIYHTPNYSHGVGIKYVRNDEFWVPFHIPGRPLLPGVLMIEAAAQLCSIMFRRKTGKDNFLGFTRCDHVSFRGQVEPGNELILTQEVLKFGHRRMVCKTQGLVNGRMVFEGQITGMTI